MTSITKEKIVALLPIWGIIVIAVIIVTAMYLVDSAAFKAKFRRDPAADLRYLCSQYCRNSTQGYQFLVSDDHTVITCTCLTGLAPAASSARPCDR